MSQLRIVADTNVYVSALNFGGVAEEVLALVRQHKVALFVSPFILHEIEGVLLSPKFNWAPSRIQEALAEIQELAQVVHPRRTVAAVPADETDNRILECALEAQASLVVSGDSHLTSLKTFEDIAIVTPRELLYAAGGL